MWHHGSVRRCEHWLSHFWTAFSFVYFLADDAWRCRVDSSSGSNDRFGNTCTWLVTTHLFWPITIRCHATLVDDGLTPIFVHWSSFSAQLSFCRLTIEYTLWSVILSSILLHLGIITKWILLHEHFPHRGFAASLSISLSAGEFSKRSVTPFSEPNYHTYDDSHGTFSDPSLAFKVAQRRLSMR